MDCEVVREAISADLDGEETNVSTELMNQHLERCESCRDWGDLASSAHRRFRVQPADVVPDLRSSVMSAITEARSERRSPVRPLRWIVACCGLLQLVLTVPTFSGAGGPSVHLDHELGSWDAALAIGLLVAAWRPERAWGMLPLVGAIGAMLAVTSFVDVATTRAAMSAESTHLIAWIGSFFLWILVREYRRATPATGLEVGRLDPLHTS